MSLAARGPSPGEPGPFPVEDRLRLLQVRHGDRVPLGEIAAVIADLLRSAGHESPVPHPGAAALRGELEALARYIERSKREISAIRCDDIAAEHIPLASGELGAIGAHLEDATGVILDACERLEAAGRRAGGETEATISGIVTRVYEACSFQDITGQRITKIVHVLGTIEERVGRLLSILRHELGPAGAGAGGRGEADGRDRQEGDARLLNGPQVPGAANSQAEIDALLAALD